MDQINWIQSQTDVNLKQVQAVIDLKSQDATIPFIARYRKEKTGGLDDLTVSKIFDLHEQSEKLLKRKEAILKAIEEQGGLKEDLKAKILNSWDEKDLEDLYLPFKQKRKTKADTARDLGLEPLAKMLMSQNAGDPIQMAGRFVKNGIKSEEEALEQACFIMAEWFSERSFLRSKIRYFVQKNSELKTKLNAKADKEKAERYRDYHDYSERANRVPSHRFLAVQRALEEGILKGGIKTDKKEAFLSVKSSVIKSNVDATAWVEKALKDAVSRLLVPSMENELCSDIKEKSDREAINVFASNLEQLLLQAPLGPKRVLAIDPGYRTGCKIACVDENGNLTGNDTIYPHAPQNKRTEAMKKIATMISQHKIEAIAVGNGTASRETESLLKKMRFDREVNVFVVNEAGASVYSASSVGRAEFPNFDVTVRGAVSIARRLQDPLSELVKIDPKAIGVGQYQHDVNQVQLKKSLDRVVESCVNKVGVELNTASPYLLQYVSGIGPKMAEKIIDHRKKVGSFVSKSDLKNVSGLGEKIFELSAGFIRVKNGSHPFDDSAVHPESYEWLTKVLEENKIRLDEAIGKQIKDKVNVQSDLFQQIGGLDAQQVLFDLEKAGRDLRSKIKIVEFDSKIKELKDIEPGALLNGVVNNITNFGAFIDVGIKESGLVHISEIANEFIKHPNEKLKLYQAVKVKVLEVDLGRKRLQLSIRQTK
jgi:uncharacterized protein